MISNRLFQFTFYSESKHTLVHQYIDRVIKSNNKMDAQPLVIFTPNPEQIMMAQNDAEFASALSSADLLIPDGVGLVAASRLLAFVGKGKALHQRVSGIDLFQALVAHFAETKAVVIGGRSDAVSATTPSALSVGKRTLPWLSGYENVQHPTNEEERAVEAFLKAQKPKMVFVAFGAPFQEYWSLRHKALLQKLGVKVVLVIGGSVDVVSGKLKRAPKLLRSLGLEWLFRLIQEPWRWKRQLSLVRFLGLTLRTAISD